MKSFFREVGARPRASGKVLARGTVAPRGKDGIGKERDVRRKGSAPPQAGGTPPLELYYKLAYNVLYSIEYAYGMLIFSCSQLPRLSCQVPRSPRRSFRLGAMKALNHVTQLKKLQAHFARERRAKSIFQNNLKADFGPDLEDCRVFFIVLHQFSPIVRGFSITKID